MMESILYQFPGIAGVYCLFTGRGPGHNPLSGNVSWHIGDSREQVIAARAEIMAICAGLGLSAWAECRQVHGTELLDEPAPLANPLREEALVEADGMMSARPGLALLIKTADCQPLLLADDSGQHIMALHVGWRGNAAGFPQIAVRAFCDKYGLAPKNLRVARGPSLGPNHAEFVNFDGEWGAEYAAWFNPVNKCVDLWALTRAQLVLAGIPEAHIAGMPICTFANHHAWFSYRRNRNAGRQAALIWIAANRSEDAL